MFCNYSIWCFAITVYNALQWQYMMFCSYSICFAMTIWCSAMTVYDVLQWQYMMFCNYSIWCFAMTVYDALQWQYMMFCSYSIWCFAMTVWCSAMTIYDVLQWNRGQGLWKRRGLSHSTIYHFILYFCLTQTDMAIAERTEILGCVQYKMQLNPRCGSYIHTM
jgi:hypothetical protein